MIIKGRPRGGGSQLAAYLLNREGPESAQILEMRGLDCFNGDLRNALIGMEVDGKIAACEKPLYHASFRLEEGAELTPEQWKEAADRLEKKLGLEGHERALIIHEENGDQHLHVVWNKIDQETLRAARLEFDALKRLDVARELERDFGTRQLANEHTQEHPTRADYEQAKRSGRNINEIKAEIRDCWERSDNGAALENALAEAGYILAKGDKRDFVAVDPTGQEYTIGKRITGASATQVKTKCADLDREALPSVAQAKEYQAEQQRQHEQARADRAREEQAKARAVIKEAWEKSKSGEEFETALDQSGFVLAKTGKEFMPVVALDEQGRVYSIGLTVGETSKATREAMSDLDPAKLPTIEESQKYLHQVKLAEGLRSQDAAEQQRAAAEFADQARLQMRGETETKTDFKDAAQEFKAIKKENLDWNHANDLRRIVERFEKNARSAQEPPQGKTNPEAKTQAPQPEKIATRATKALSGGGLELLGGLGEKIAGPVTYEGIKQVAAQDQKHAFKGLDAAAQDYSRALTPEQKEQKARELDRAAREARKASEAYREAARNAGPGEARRAAMRAENRAHYEAKKAEQEAARLRETDQQRQEREAREQEEERRRRKQRERER